MSSCLSLDNNKKCFKHNKIDTESGYQAQAAGNVDLNVIGTVNFKLTVKGTKLAFLVCTDINHDIMSILLANQLELPYDANTRRLCSIAPIDHSLVVHHQFLLPA